MKRLIDFAGGRNLVNDDLAAIQANLDNLALMWGQVGPFVISGVNFSLVSGNLFNVSAGLVMLNGRVVEFPAQQMDLTASKAITQVVTDVDSREYDLLGISKPGNKNYAATVVAGTIGSPVVGNEYIFVQKVAGVTLPQVRRFRHALDEMQYRTGTMLMVNNSLAGKFVPATFSNSYGIDEWLGWELRTAAQGSIAPGADLRDLALIGAGGAYAVGDSPDLLATSGATSLLTLYAVHMVQFIGTRDLWTNSF